MKKIILLFCVIIAAKVSFAQLQQRIRGKIFDLETKEPLFGATVAIQSLDPIIGTSTDFNGAFTFENISLGRHTIQISYLGYETKTISNLELTAAKELLLNIGLQESVVSTGSVIVIGKKRIGESINKIATVSAQEFSVEQAERYAGALNDVSRMAQNFAGVQGSDDSRNDIVVRGNTPSGILYRIDGVDVPNPNHFASLGTTGGPVGLLNVNVLENSDFLTSAFPAEYGNALSGVFDIHLRKGNEQKHEFLGQISFNGFEIGAEGPLSKNRRSSYLINYRYSTLGLLNLLGVNFGTGAAVPQYQDLFFKLNFPYKKGSVAFWGIGGTSNIAFLDSEKEEGEVDLFSNNAEDLRFGSSIGVLGLNHIHRINKKSYLKTILSLDLTKSTTNLDKIDTAILQPKDFYDQKSFQGKNALRFVFNHKFNTRHLLQVGLNNQLKFYSLRDSVIMNNSDTYTILSDSKGTTLLSQAYAQWQYKVSQRLKLNIGLAGQFFALNQKGAIEPKLGLKWQWHPKHNIGFGYGYHSRLQNLNIYFNQTQNALGEEIFINRNLGFTKAHHIVLSYRWEFLKNALFKTEIYYQKLENVPVEVEPSSFSILNFGSSFGELFLDSLVNNGSGHNYGIEFTFEKQLQSGWYLLSTSSLYQSKYKGSDGVRRNTAFNGQFALNLLGGKEFELLPKKENKKFILALLADIKLTYSGGNRYTPIDVEKSRLQGEAVYIFEEAFQGKNPDYFRTDLNLGFKMNYKKITNELIFTIQNLTNRKNVFNQVFNSTTGDLEFNYQRGFFPMVSYQFTF